MESDSTEKELELQEWLSDYTNSLYRLLNRHKNIFKDRDVFSVFRDFVQFEVILRNRLQLEQEDFEYDLDDKKIC